MWFLRYASGQTYGQTDRQTYMLICILRTLTWGDAKKAKKIQDHVSVTAGYM